jgi:hypothetical protein
MAAEIEGVDLSRLTDEQVAEIRAALFRHKMICEMHRKTVAREPPA